MLIRIINVDPNNHGAFKYINNTLKRIGYGCELVENESKNEKEVSVNKYTAGGTA